MEYIASETEGLSGADLQAVVYNAHLEVIQASIADIGEEETPSKGKGKGKGKEVDGKGKSKGKSNTEEKTPKAEKKRMWKQIAPEGGHEVPGLAARVSLFGPAVAIS
jgi:peroxin-1